jgi:two-component system, sensor histidine kinase YesM
VGIPPELLSTILTVSKSEGAGGYGVFNINERIQLAFGKEYGLSYESTPGAGTTVTIRLPIWAHPLYA